MLDFIFADLKLALLFAAWIGLNVYSMVEHWPEVIQFLVKE